jgi:trans-2,3-dihydro-3-hydroxyanthranilate isomerase
MPTLSAIKNMPYPYAIYDVFTQTPLAGNPLAVVFDAQGLSDEAMPAITREFNLSETVFVLPPETVGHSARIRIFTPAHELPFAGHPTVGTAVALAERMQPGANLALVLEENIGPVSCNVQANGQAAAFARFDLPRLPESVPAQLNVQGLAVALGLTPAQVGFDDHRIGVWSAGVPFLMVPVNSLDAVNQLRFDAKAWMQAAPLVEGRTVSAYVYCRGGVSAEAYFHARAFVPDMGLSEDPATGAAVAAMTGALHVAEAWADGPHALLIEQGFAMGRPSQIHVDITVAQRILKSVSIGGFAVRIANGTLAL